MIIHYLKILVLNLVFCAWLFAVVDSCKEPCNSDSDCGLCSPNNPCCICAPHWNTSIDNKACRPSCERIHNKYVGYPECKERLEWMHLYWYRVKHTQTYIDGGVDGTICSIQNYIANEVGPKGNIEAHCPDPYWEDHSMDKVRNKDGSITFLVYRALRSHPWNDPTGRDKWATRLLNANAASLGGVLGYLHTEVVPDDMREQSDKENCLRKWDYDSIMVFNVTIKTPTAFQTTYNNMLGPFVAYDSGRCSAGVTQCDYENVHGAFGPGRQDQSGNTRHKYSNAWWYSFPQCGFCEWPTGEPDCTYTYNVVGRYNIDDLVFPQLWDKTGCKGGTMGPCKDLNEMSDQKTCEWWDTDTEEGKSCRTGMTEVSKETFLSWCRAGKKEYVRNRPIANVDDCVHLGDYAQTVGGLDFWYYVCESRMCNDRMQLLDKLPLDTSWFQAGEGPTPEQCRPGYTIEPGKTKWNPDTSVHTTQTLSRDKCEAKCTADIGCEAFAWTKSNEECRIYQYGSLMEQGPDWWSGNYFYHRNIRPAPTSAPPPTLFPTPFPTTTTTPTLSPTQSPLDPGMTTSPTPLPTPIPNERAGAGGDEIGGKDANSVLWIFVALLTAIAVVAVGLFVVCRLRTKQDNREKELLLQDDTTGNYQPPSAGGLAMDEQVR